MGFTVNILCYFFFTNCENSNWVSLTQPISLLFYAISKQLYIYFLEYSLHKFITSINNISIIYGNRQNPFPCFGIWGYCFISDASSYRKPVEVTQQCEGVFRTWGSVENKGQMVCRGRPAMSELQ